jgi:hypothetical protein
MEKLMKPVYLSARAALIFVATSLLLAHYASAQDKVYRCGNEYTNNVKQAESKGCKLVEGGNVTVVQGTKVGGNSPVRVASASPSSSGGGTSTPRNDSAEQKARDSDLKGILEGELKKAESKLADLQKEYNNGEPEKLGPETRNHQKYLDRVAELKASIARQESDITSLKRELGRASR